MQEKIGGTSLQKLAGSIAEFSADFATMRPENQRMLLRLWKLLIVLRRP
jgi:hypothetical protein